MTNPDKVVCSSEDYLLSETDDPRVYFLTRRDEGEFDENYSGIAADMFHSFIALSMFSAEEACPILANYSFELSKDKKVVRIYIISQEELSDDESADNSEFADSQDDAPTAEEISALIERKKKEKTFWYKLKKIFRH